MAKTGRELDSRLDYIFPQIYTLYFTHSILHTLFCSLYFSRSIFPDGVEQLPRVPGDLPRRPDDRVVR
ncbi:MAG: hypothetical protein ACI9G1_005692 [Pirellulaceae bacterium]